MNNNYTNIRFGFSTKMLFLFSIFLVCLYMVTVVTSLLINRYGATHLILNIQIALQNIFVFAFPAFALAVFISRKPFCFLRLQSAPSMRAFLFMVIGIVVALPAMNYVIEWNANIKLPASMSGIEQVLRQYEDTAQSITDNLTKGNTLYGMLMLVLTIGMLTGFGEEVFFRGMLTRLFLEKSINKHVAVWIGAFVFSLMHFQFYGFVPRMLLGGFFGYLMIWSNSLWLPIIAHAINNSMAIISIYMYEQKALPVRIDEVGHDSILLVIVSLALTAVLFYKKALFFDKSKTECL